MEVLPDVMEQSGLFPGIDTLNSTVCGFAGNADVADRFRMPQIAGGGFASLYRQKHFGNCR